MTATKRSARRPQPCIADPTQAAVAELISAGSAGRYNTADHARWFAAVAQVLAALEGPAPPGCGRPT